MKTRTSHVLHNKDNVFGCVNDLVKADNILMFHLFHKFDLSLDRFSAIGVEQFILFVYFHSYFLISWFVQSNSYNCIGTLTNLFANDIIVKGALV